MSPNIKKIAIAAAAVVLLGVIVLVVVSNNKKTSTGVNAPSGPGIPGAGTPGGSATRADITTPIAVPDRGNSSTAANVAVPVIQSPASPGGDSSYRSFTLAISASGFSPNTVIAKQGDVIDLNITSSDGTYDFTQPDYGFHVTLTKGQSKKIQFQATATGKFTFYCSSCGGPSKGPTGYIDVVPVTQ